MTLSRLVLQITHQRLLIAETCCELFCIGEVAASILTDVDDDSVTEGEVAQDLVQTTIANGACEAAIVRIADIIVEDPIAHTGGDAVVCVEVFALECVAEIRRIVLVPTPIAAVVERRIEVHMAITQFAQHIREHLEQLVLVGFFPRAYLIYIIYSIPVEAVFMLLIVEETVVLIDNLPKGLKVPLSRIREFFLIDAGRSGEQGQEEPDNDLSHG